MMVTSFEEVLHDHRIRRQEPLARASNDIDSFPIECKVENHSKFNIDRVRTYPVVEVRQQDQYYFDLFYVMRKDPTLFRASYRRC